MIGATGLVGNACLQQLLASPYYDRVTVVVRRPLSLSHHRLSCLVLPNFDDLATLAPKLVARDVYCCLGTTIRQAGSQAAFRHTDYDYALQFAQLTLAHQAQQFLLVSAMGADARSSIFYNRVKGELEAALKKMNIPALHILQPSLLLGNRSQQPARTSEALAQWLFPRLNPIMVGWLRPYRAISCTAVATALVRLAQRQQKGIFTYPSDQIQAIANNNVQ